MIEELLKKYEPENYKLIIKPLVKEESNYLGIGCIGEYSRVKFGIDADYWYLVVKNDEIDDNE
jgi:hypothetical protein